MAKTNDTKTFEYNGATITLVGRPKNRHRELLRQVYRKISAADPALSAGTASDFASIVVYTEKVDGDVWTPPSPYATGAELATALEAWLDEDEALTVQWVQAIEGNDPN